MAEKTRTAGWKLLENISGGPASASQGRIVCVANQKGGVAKTTTTVNLAAALALRGHEVLVVDLDPQGDATTGLGVERGAVRSSTYDLLMGTALEEVVVRTAVERLQCVPSSLDLAGAEIELVDSPAREHKLAHALATAPARYGFVFIDCPPSLGLLTINGLVAGQDLVVPVQCEYYALEGLGQLLETSERVRRTLNPRLRVAGLLLTMFDARTKLASDVAADVRSHFGELVYATMVPRSVRLSEAPSFGGPVVRLDPSARGAIAYRLLAAEVEARYGLAQHAPPPPPPPPPPHRPSPSSRLVPSIAAGVPGTAGRGYGVRTAEPALEGAFPRVAPWASGP